VSQRPTNGPFDGGLDASAGDEERNSMDALETENAQLRAALDSRVAIEQAKGILAERFALELPEAFLLLRRAARTSRSNLRAVAHAVVVSPATPHEVLVVREGDGRPDG
jgi:hypothetical protein